MREVEDDVARLVDQSHILGHVLSRIRDEYMHDQAEVDGIRNELEQAKKAQEVVAMRTIEAREKQFAAREQLATKRAEMDAAQATWVHELQSLRSMNVEEIQILKDFQFRKESRKKIPSEVEVSTPPPLIPSSRLPEYPSSRLRFVLSAVAGRSRSWLTNLSGSQEELSSMAAARAVEGQMEAAERAKREEAVQMRAEIMQSTIDKLLAISGASSVEELVAFFEEKELRRHRTLATMSEREARLQALAADLQAKQSELQEIRFFASQGLSIDDNLRRQVELSESYEDKVSPLISGFYPSSRPVRPAPSTLLPRRQLGATQAPGLRQRTSSGSGCSLKLMIAFSSSNEKVSGYVLRTTKTVALTTSLLSGFVRSLAARLVASGFDLGGLRPIPERGSTPRARYEGAGGDGVAETMQNAAEERERQLERRRRAAIREAFEERRNAKPPADELPPAAVGPQRPDDLSKSVGESSPRRDAPATSSAAAMSPAPGASRRSSAQDHDQARASPGASGQHALAEESQEGLRGPMGASSRLPSLRQQWERDHDEAVHLLLEVEQKLDGPMGAMGMRGPSEVSFGQHRSAPKSRKKPAPVLETDSSMLSLGAGLDASTPGTATPDEGGPVGPGRSVKRMSSLSTLAIARQNLQVVMDVQEMLRSGRDTLPANNTRVNPAQQEQHERDKEIMNWLLEHQPALRRRLHESMMDTIATIKDLASTCCALGLECTVSELNRVFALPEMRSSGSSTGKFDMGEFLADSDNEVRAGPHLILIFDPSFSILKCL